MGLSNPAGSHTFYICPNEECKKRIKIFENSWCGNGTKICPYCKTRIPWNFWIKGKLVRNKLKLHRNQKE